MKKKLAQALKIRNRKPYLVVDLLNRFKYGPSAPKFGEVVWVDPKNCKKYLPLSYFRTNFGLSRQDAKAKIIENDWPEEQTMPINELPLIKNCIDHWVNNIPWEKTGECERMLKLIKGSNSGVSHGCSSREDVIKRCRNLDAIFEQAKLEGCLRKSNEVSPDCEWGAKEILIHIGPDGEFFKGGEGMHRFAIAYILDIPFPAELGCVHISALSMLDSIRKIDWTELNR